MSEITAFIKEYFDWATEINKKSSEVHTATAHVNFRMTTNNKMPITGPHSYASYAEGTLNFKPAQTKGTVFKAAEFFTSEPIEQYFSDRRYDLPPQKQPVGPPLIPTAPFSPSKTDKIKLIISNRAINTAKTLGVTIEMVTWGGGLVHFNMEVRNGMLVGLIDSNTFCVIAFSGKYVFKVPE